MGVSLLTESTDSDSMIDVKQHLATTKMVQHSSGNQSLRTLLAQSPIEESVTRAKVLFAKFVAEHNLILLITSPTLRQSR